MQIHQLKPTKKQKKGKRVGRGGKRGTYSGRGIKGQKARAGRKMKPIIRELIKRYPKLRGYRFSKISPKMEIVNLKALEVKFQEGEIVSPATLTQKKLVRKQKGRLPIVKILGQGDLTKKLIFENCIFSEKAFEKVQKLGCKIK
jgi:large subunit ribosomal protein L15